MIIRLCIGFVLFVMLSPQVLWSYPSAERGRVNLSLNTATGFGIDNARDFLIVTSGETISIIDVGSLALVGSSQTPYDISNDEDLTGSIKDVVVDSSNARLYALQDGGTLLTYNLDSLTTAPTRTDIATSKDLSMMEHDTDRGELLMLNTTDSAIVRYGISGGAVQAEVKISTEGSVTVNQMRYIPSIRSGSGNLYMTSGSGILYILPSGGAAVTKTVLDAGGGTLTGIAATPASDVVFIANSSGKLLHRLVASSNSLERDISLSANSGLDAMVIADVTNPSAAYGFVVGSLGLSIFNTSDDDVFDVGTTDDDDEPLSISGTGPIIASDDGYVYISSGDIIVISDRPFVTFSSITYSSGGSSLGAGENVTIAFQADVAGTYETYFGGDTSKNGSAFADSTGATSGTIATAATDQSVIFNYDDSSLWEEGVNNLFFFVQDSDGLEGRRAAQVSIDTPPPAVSIASVGFGNGKIYVNIDRLSQADIATYQVYVDADAAAIAAATTVSGSLTQPSSGSASVEITGLTNGTSYFVGAEAVDSAGNVGPRTTTLANGSVATGLPEATVGPAGLAGEAGCTLMRE